MTINIEQLKRDREAGTDGPWRVEDGQIWDSRSDGEPGIPMFRGVTDYRRWGRDYTNRELAINARRIARLPDLEAAFLEAVELMKHAQRYDADFCHDCGISQFLEKLK